MFMSMNQGRRLRPEEVATISMAICFEGHVYWKPIDVDEATNIYLAKYHLFHLVGHI